MTLKELEYFVCVVDCGSINKAAQVLYISQPYLSQVIKGLEEQMQVRLFKRGKSGIALTAQGEEFIIHARKIVAESSELRRVFFEGSGKKEILSITMTKFSHVMEAFIDVCKNTDELSEFNYRLNEGSLMDVIEDLKTHSCEVGVIHFEHTLKKEWTKIIKRNALKYHHLLTTRPHVVLRINHPAIEGRSSISLKTLQNYGFVRYIGESEDFIYSVSIEGEVIDLADSPKIVSIYGRASLLHLIADTDFYTIGIKNFDVQEATYNLVSLPIENCDNELLLGYIISDKKKLSHGAELFIKYLEEKLLA